MGNVKIYVMSIYYYILMVLLNCNLERKEKCVKQTEG